MTRILGVGVAGWVLLVCLVAAFLALPSTAVGVAAARPSFVVILADDMGYSDIGSYGGEIATPLIAHWPWVVRPLRRGVTALGLVSLAAVILVFAWLWRRRMVK